MFVFIVFTNNIQDRSCFCCMPYDTMPIELHAPATFPSPPRTATPSHSTDHLPNHRAGGEERKHVWLLHTIEQAFTYVLEDRGASSSPRRWAASASQGDDLSRRGSRITNYRRSR